MTDRLDNKAKYPTIGKENRMAANKVLNDGMMPSPVVSCIPVLSLLAALIAVIVLRGASAVQEHAAVILLLAAVAGCVVSAVATPLRPVRMIVNGILRSARQVLPTVPILMLIGSLSATWMLSGVVPAMIDLGVGVMRPAWFLPLTCALCAVVSVITGSSWTTIATIGVGFMGIGSAMGYSSGWMAGAIISGAYFGDKVSPLSDTTVLAASSCGVPLMSHIRNLMWTSLPALIVALAVFGIAGVSMSVSAESHAAEMTEALRSVFHLSPWLLVIPSVTVAMILLRCSTLVVLAAGTLSGLAGIFIFQPSVVDLLGGGGLLTILRVVFASTSLATGSELLDPLVSTGGVAGMLPTIILILSAMVFGGVMIGAGMLEAITSWVTRRLRSPRSLIAATCGSGLFFNSCTGDQYLSLIIGGNVFRKAYEDNRVCPTALSRTLEDSVSVTSVLIPWNSCGLTQSAVLGVATLAYLPYCIFNLCSPLMTLLLAFAGWKIRTLRGNPPYALGSAVRVVSN